MGSEDGPKTTRQTTTTKGSKPTANMLLTKDIGRIFSHPK